MMTIPGKRVDNGEKLLVVEFSGYDNLLLCLTPKGGFECLNVEDVEADVHWLSHKFFENECKGDHS